MSGAWDGVWSKTLPFLPLLCFSSLLFLSSHPHSRPPCFLSFSATHSTHQSSSLQYPSPSSFRCHLRMLGHIAGRPSPAWDKIQAVVVLFLRYCPLLTIAAVFFQEAGRSTPLINTCFIHVVCLYDVDLKLCRVAQDAGDWTWSLSACPSPLETIHTLADPDRGLDDTLCCSSRRFAPWSDSRRARKEDGTV
jgi:hypothetical protein